MHPSQIPAIAPEYIPILKESLCNIHFADIEIFNTEASDSKSDKNPIVRYLCREAASIAKIVCLTITVEYYTG